MKVSFITVTWNSKDDCEGLIDSIKKHMNEYSYEVIVVDNNSSDGTAEYISTNYPEVVVIANTDNKGYAGGMNQGYQVSSGEYIVFMNPDMKFEENSWAVIQNELDKNPLIGIVAPQLRYGDGTVQPTVKKTPTLISQVLILLKLHHFIKPPSLRTYLSVDFDYTLKQDVQRVMGAFIATTRVRFEAFGPWDEDYPLWWEDEQLCQDALDHNFLIRYTPETYVTHYEGKSFAQVLSLPKQKRFNKGMRVYFKKNKGTGAYLILLLIHPISLLLAYLVQIFKIKPRSQSNVTRQ